MRPISPHRCTGASWRRSRCADALSGFVTHTSTTWVVDLPLWQSVSIKLPKWQSTVLIGSRECVCAKCNFVAGARHRDSCVRSVASSIRARTEDANFTLRNRFDRAGKCAMLLMSAEKTGLVGRYPKYLSREYDYGTFSEASGWYVHTVGYGK